MLGDVAAAAGGAVLPGSARRPVGKCVIDSRKAEAGDLFFALRGSRADGHDFVDRVLRKNGMAVVEKGGLRRDVVVVADVKKALSAAARWRRSAIPGRVVAVTGSNGKTTTRRLLAAALGTSGTVYETTGNFNNDLGMPLVILNAPDPPPDFMVLELGMNHAGELLELGSVADPTDSMVTGIGRAHMEFFESVEDIARAKAELLEVTRAGGRCVIPAGRPILLEAARRRGLTVKTFGDGGDAWLEILDEGRCLLHPWGVEIHPRLRGRHNMRNALAAVTMAVLQGIAPAEAASAVESVPPEPGRGRVVKAGGLLILDESYNANPDSTMACLEVLGSVAGKKAAVLGDMLELGEDAPAYHGEVLEKADSMGLEFLVLVGGIYGSVADAVKNSEVFTAGDWKEALEILGRRAGPGTAVLVKGSRSMGLDRLVRSLERVE